MRKDRGLATFRNRSPERDRQADFYGIRVKVSGFFFLDNKKKDTWQIVKKKSKQKLYYYMVFCPTLGFQRKFGEIPKKKKSVLTA